MRMPVFYRPEQSCAAAVGYSPSAGKPALVVADWLSNPEISPYIQIETFVPASDEVLCAAHDPSYIDGVLSGELKNGFGNHSPEIARSLRYTVGSMVAACKYVLANSSESEPAVACSPTSGFHHAGYDFGGGFCTFNGLMAAAIRVHELGLADKILILDMDHHRGNGTENIIDVLGIDYITHITAGKSYTTAGQAVSIGRHLLYGIPNRRRFDLVIFQAGADMHIDDPLGGLLDTRQMKSRDKMTFLSCNIGYMPIVWNLAGGYQRDVAGAIEPVLALHRQTMRQALSEFEYSPDPPTQPS